MKMQINLSVKAQLKFGIAGIAFGTFLGYLSSIFVFAKWIFFDSQTLKPILYFSASQILKVFKSSYVYASYFLYIGFGNMILNAFFLKTFGEKNFDGIKKVMKLSIKSQLFSGAVLIPIIFIFSTNIAGLFSIDDAILGKTVFAIRAIAFSMPFIALPMIFGLFFGLEGFFIGMMSASIATCVIFSIILRVRHGKSFPLLLSAADIVSRDENLNFERVLELRDWAEAEFIKRGFDSMVTMKISLIIEEVGMSIVENNPNNEPLVELTLIFGEKMQIIIRDNGKRFDLTDEKVDSFRSFFLYSFLAGSSTDRSCLTTQNYNRHIFTLTKQ